MQRSRGRSPSTRREERAIRAFVNRMPEKLRPFIVQRAGEDIVGVSEAAARLEVSRTTVYQWVEKNTLIAWRSTKRRLSIPAAQILGPRTGDTGARGCRRHRRRSRVGLGVPHPRMAVRGRGGGTVGAAEGGPSPRGAERCARIRRHLHVSGTDYPRDRIESVLLKARFPDSYSRLAASGAFRRVSMPSAARTATLRSTTAQDSRS